MREEEGLQIPVLAPTPVVTPAVEAVDFVFDPTSLRQPAYDFVMSRRDAYEEQGLIQRRTMRAVGYLYHYWNLLLLATLPPEPVQYGRNVVTLRNIMNDANYPKSSYMKANGIPNINCSLWTIYARANGPEIFGGRADAVLKNGATGTCARCMTDDNHILSTHSYWEFLF